MIHFSGGVFGAGSVWGSTTLDTELMFDYHAATSAWINQLGQTTGGIGMYRSNGNIPYVVALDGGYMIDAYTLATVFVDGRYSFSVHIPVTLAESLGMTDAATALTHYVASMSETVNLSGVSAANRAIAVALAEALSLADASLFVGVYGVQLPESLLLRDTIDTNAALVSYVVNSNTNAMSTYSNFNFNSFMQMGNKFYGVASDGIYELAGATDAGTDISAALRFGKNDLSSEAAEVASENMKMLPTVYMGVNTNGRMQLRVTANGVSNDYELTQRTSNSLHTGRMTLGKGVKSRYWDFELTNIAGADFTVESITLFPEVLKRRVQES